jgi:hypothetical protein
MLLKFQVKRKKTDRVLQDTVIFPSNIVLAITSEQNRLGFEIWTDSCVAM